MLYIVECGFSDPMREQAWNDYYSVQKLGEVLAVPGFRTSQRFKAVFEMPAPYFAIHTVDSLDVFKSPTYLNLGGGRFDQSFQPCITNWVRSFYKGIDRAPAIGMDEWLAVCDQPQKAAGTGINFTWLVAAIAEVPVQKRGIACLKRAQAEPLLRSRNPDLALYAPMMARHEEAPGKALR